MLLYAKDLAPHDALHMVCQKIPTFGALAAVILQC